MKIEHLQWDSIFFGIKTGRIIFNQSEDDLLELLPEARNQNYKLLYVFSDEYIELSDNILSKWNGYLVDRKIVYQKEVCCYNVLNKKIVSPYTSFEISKDLLDLAYISGSHSRFRLDKKFPTGSFERMYKEWLLKSLNGELADMVYVASENNKILGFVSLKCKDNIGEIGLIAVNNEVQGKGLGTKLINACEKYLTEKSIYTLFVATQLNNKQACQFYEKYSFKKHKATNIYHFWI